MPVPSIGGDAVRTALGDFLAAVLPSTVEISQGQENRVPEPTGPDFITIWPINRGQLSTNVHRWDTVGNLDNIGRQTSFDLQMDIHGPNSEDYAQVVSTLLRDFYGVAFFRPLGLEPLYCNDGQQMPFVNGQGQYEQRWTMMATLQALPIVTVTQEYADDVVVDIELANPYIGASLDFSKASNSMYVPAVGL